MSGELPKARPLAPEYTLYKRDNLSLKYGRLFSPLLAESLMTRLEEEVKYADPKDCMIKVFGKWYNIPRQQAAYGDPGVTYTYSGKRVPTLEWTPLMEELREAVQIASGHTYNFVLVNRYRNGLDRIGFHADDEISIDRQVPITSLSFGAARDFVFRRIADKTDQLKLVLEPGSILLMEPPTNQFWHHSLPQTKKCKLPRVNLTFRRIKT